MKYAIYTMTKRGDNVSFTRLYFSDDLKQLSNAKFPQVLTLQEVLDDWFGEYPDGAITIQKEGE